MEEINYPQGVITRAIHAIENQRLRSSNAESTDIKRQREQFFRLMNEIQGDLFSAVAAAANAGKTSLLVGEVAPGGFNSKVQEIYGRGLGVYPSRDLNDWLYANDLKHLFHVDLLTIHW